MNHIESIFSSRDYQPSTDIYYMRCIHQQSQRYRQQVHQNKLNSQNKRILDRLVDIASKDKSDLSQKNQTHRPCVSLNKLNIKKELRRINQDNERLAARLINCKPSLRTDRMEYDYYQSIKYRDLHIKFRKQLPPLPSMINSKNNSLNPSKIVEKSKEYYEDDSLDKNQIIPQLETKEKSKEPSASRKKKPSSKKRELSQEKPQKEEQEEPVQQENPKEDKKEESLDFKEEKQEEKAEQVDEEPDQNHDEIQQEQQQEQNVEN